MLLQWTILYRELVTRQRKKKVDAFADPLEGAEWDGFGWFVKWIEKSAERRSAADRRGRGAPDAASRTERPPQSHVLFPFARQALRNLFDAMNERDNGLTWKTPRSMLRAVVSPFLEQAESISIEGQKTDASDRSSNKIQ